MDLESLLFGKEEWSFLLNAFIRTVIMFIVILVGLRILGKRGIHQLSVFELGVIIGLGSAAGDPMFYRDVGILPAIVVFAVVIALYRLVTFLVAKSDRIETLLEGRPAYILRDGIILEAFKKQPLGHDEFFAALRQGQVSHLGQVETVIIEADGYLSVFYYPDDKVHPGLPILPHELDKCTAHIAMEGMYSCIHCGCTELLIPSPTFKCRRCGHDKCVSAMDGKRVV
jgi:uncharacterized membrane protein YcaP (DUF421 family)